MEIIAGYVKTSKEDTFNSLKIITLISIQLVLDTRRNVGVQHHIEMVDTCPMPPNARAATRNSEFENTKLHNGLMRRNSMEGPFEVFEYKLLAGYWLNMEEELGTLIVTDSYIVHSLVKHQ